MSFASISAWEGIQGATFPSLCCYTCQEALESSTAASEADFEVIAHRRPFLVGLPVKLLRLAGRLVHVPDLRRAMCWALQDLQQGMPCKAVRL